MKKKNVVHILRFRDTSLSERSYRYKYRYSLYSHFHEALMLRPCQSTDVFVVRIPLSVWQPCRLVYPPPIVYCKYTWSADWCCNDAQDVNTHCVIEYMLGKFLPVSSYDHALNLNQIFCCREGSYKWRCSSSTVRSPSKVYAFLFLSATSTTEDKFTFADLNLGNERVSIRRRTNSPCSQPSTLDEHRSLTSLIMGLISDD